MNLLMDTFYMLSIKTWKKPFSVHVDLNNSARHLAAFRLLSGVLLRSGVLLIGFAVPSYADVYLDSEQALRDKTDALVDVLSNSVSPGGNRAVSINGVDLRVRRYANVAGDKSEFYRVWQDAKVKKLEANIRVLEIVKTHDPVQAAIAEQAPYKPIAENYKQIIKIGEQFAQKQASLLKNRVLDSLETPFAYETAQHRVIAKIPVKAIDADSVLVRESAGDGYLFLSEKLPKSTVSTGFWQIEMGENFTFSQLFGASSEDGNDDVEGGEPSIPRFPGSRLSMVYTEDANAWQSGSWSYESSGDILSHLTHYIAAFESAGFRKESNSIVESKLGLVQFASKNEEATLFVELLNPLDHSVQVTLQIRNN